MDSCKCLDCFLTLPKQGMKSELDCGDKANPVLFSTSAEGNTLECPGDEDGCGKWSNGASRSNTC